MDLSEAPKDPLLQRHPWEIARANFFERVLREGGLEVARWLDAGSGDAWLGRRLRRRTFPEAHLTLLDINYDDAWLEHLAQAEGGFVHGTRELEDGPFDLVTALDLLEHVDEDDQLLDELVERLRPGGHVLMSVPAWPLLYSRHDRALYHHRRYRPEEAHQRVLGAGLTILREGGLFHSPLVVRVLQRVAEVAWPRANGFQRGLEWSAPEGLTRVVSAALRADTAVSARLSESGIRAPGLSYWALARKDT